MKKFFRWLLIFLLVVALIYLLGPSPQSPAYSKELPLVPTRAASLIQYVHDNETAHKLKEDNEARIVWANDSMQKTEYAIVYLHGFSASQGEGNPVHREIAKRFGANLYLSRLAEHGVDTTDPMINLTVDKYWESAKQALAIGKQLGNKVILMGTSTGGTFAMKLAMDYNSDVYALILLSPNLAINNDKAWILNNPWGLQIAKWVNGDPYVTAKDSRPLYKKYWHSHYPLEAAVQLQEMMETIFKEDDFKKITQPTLMLYYYKDPVHQDSVVKVDAMLQAFEKLGTSADKKIKIAMPATGDHVIGSYIKSKDVVGVEKQVEIFMQRTLKLEPSH